MNTGGDAQGDTLISIENVTGSGFDDSLTGDGGDNVLTGLAGSDTLVGGNGADLLDGGAGNDVMNGGNGTDTATYASATAGVTVTLTNVGGPQNTVGAGNDRLTSIENLTGSGFGDTLTGDGNANVLAGGAGNDTLAGGGGTDTLRWRCGHRHGRGRSVVAADRDHGRAGRHLSADGRRQRAQRRAASSSSSSPTAPLRPARSSTTRRSASTTPTPPWSRPVTGGAGTPGASGNVLSNDTDADVALGDFLTVTGVRAGTEAAGGALTGVSGSTVIAGIYGSLTIGANGAWSYALDNSDPDTQALAQGQQVTETFTYGVTDAKGQADTAQLALTITGAADAADRGCGQGLCVARRDHDPGGGAAVPTTAARAR